MPNANLIIFLGLFNAVYLQPTGHEAECGTITPEAESLILSGKAPRRGELPWYTGIYTKTSKPYKQICGGSLISTTAVVSAAHCFWSETMMKTLPASDFAVAIGNLNQAYDDPIDVGSVQKSDIAQIFLPARFRGAATHYQDDIAVLKLATTIVFESYIRPVCLDFDMNFEERQLVDGNEAKVPAWDLTDTAESKPVIVTNMKYIDIVSCIRSAPASFSPFISSDKFCAGDKSGKESCIRYASGGGIAFPDLSRKDKIKYYLRGVTSTAPSTHDKCDALPFVAFTMISKHMSLIKNVL